MRAVTAFLSIVMLIGATCGLSAGEKHQLSVTPVTAYGECEAGMTDARNKAIADALRNAVMATIGVYVESTTVGRNYQTVKDEVLLKASGFATLDSVESSAIRDGILRVKVKATISNRPLVEKLKELGLTHDWKIGVYIPETYASQPAPMPDPAAETSIIQKLLRAGFRVMDETQRRHLLKDEAAKRAGDGDAKALRDIKREYDVDIFVTGEALAEYVDENREGGITFCRARGRIEARAYYTDTGEILSITDTFADGIDQTQTLAAKQCFKSLGAEAGKAVVEDILIAPASSTPFVTVKILNLKSASSAADLQNALKELPGVTQVKRDRYTGGVLQLNVYVKSEYREEFPESVEQCRIGKRLGLIIDTWSKTYVQGRVANG